MQCAIATFNEWKVRARLGDGFPKLGPSARAVLEVARRAEEPDDTIDLTFYGRSHVDGKVHICLACRLSVESLPGVQGATTEDQRQRLRDPEGR